MLFGIPFQQHRYFLYATGVSMKSRYFDTRDQANAYMYSFCAKHGIKIECSECDKHERKYTNHNGIRFYINRV